MITDQLNKEFGSVDNAKTKLLELQELLKLSDKETKAEQHLADIKYAAKRDDMSVLAAYAKKVRIIKSKIDDASSYQIKEQLSLLEDSLMLFNKEQ